MTVLLFPITYLVFTECSQVVLMVKNLSASAGDVRDAGSIPRWGRSPGGGHGNSLQYSCLENPMDRGAWGAAVQLKLDLLIPSPPDVTN